MSQQPFTIQHARSILARITRLPDTRIPDDPSTTFEALGLDSIHFIELELDVEERYGFRVSAEDASQIRTLGDAVAYVNRRLEEKEARDITGEQG
jgi:acyl carrier protein